MSIFSVSATGRLTLMSSVADTGGIEISGASSVYAAVLGALKDHLAAKQRRGYVPSPLRHR